MNEKLREKDASDESNFSRQVGAQARRMLKSRRSDAKSVWFGLGMSGLIGWSGGCADSDRRGAWDLDRWAVSESLFMDLDATPPGSRPRLFQCVAVDGIGIWGNAGGPE